MKNFILGLSVLCSMSLGIVGCGDSGSDGGSGCANGQVPCDGVCIDEVAPTLTSIQTNVFQISCTASSCHDANAPAEMLDLSSLAASETNLIDVDAEQVDGKRVTSGDSTASYLMNKLLGEGMALGTTRMPQLKPDGLCAPKIEAIRQWIDDGAPIN
jgi:hypothetical protein